MYVVEDVSHVNQFPILENSHSRLSRILQEWGIFGGATVLQSVPSLCDETKLMRLVFCVVS